MMMMMMMIILKVGERRSTDNQKNYTQIPLVEVFPKKNPLSGEVGHHLGIWDALSEVSVKLRNSIWIWSLSQNFCLTANSKAFIYGLIWINPSLFSASQPNFCQKKNSILVSTVIPFCILIVTYRKPVFSN